MQCHYATAVSQLTFLPFWHKKEVDISVNLQIVSVFQDLFGVSVSETMLFAVAELSVGGASWRGVSGEPTEDPVKNGACLRNVTHRRWVKVRVRRLGSGGVRSSLGALSPPTDSSAMFQILIPKKVLLINLASLQNPRRAPEPVDCPEWQP